MQNYTLVYILGTGHCGSTLLELLLNRHSEILALGEIQHLRRYIALAKGQKPPGSRSRQDRLRWHETESHSLHAPFWQQVKRAYEEEADASFDQLDLHTTAKWRKIRSLPASDTDGVIQANERLLSCIRRVSGARILTDSSKSPHRLYILQNSGRFNIKVIHLQRHGCAVLNAYLRKYGSFGISVRKWVAPAVLAFYLRRKFTRTTWLQLRYEDLASDPVKTLKIVCAFLEVTFEPEMLAYRGKPYLGFGGNLLREREGETIVLDESWKHELSVKHRIAFQVIAGWLNRMYGY